MHSLTSGCMPPQWWRGTDRAHPQRFSLETLRKLYTRCSGSYKVLMRFGSSAYGLYILCDLGISPVFHVENLTRYRTSTMPKLFSVRPLQPPLLRRTATEEFVQSFPVRFYHPCCRHSPVANFSKPGRIDGNHLFLICLGYFSSLF